MITHIIAALAAHLGLSQAAVIAVLGLLVAIANIVGKAIPDTATGTLGTIRKACKVISLYVPNNTGTAPTSPAK